MCPPLTRCGKDRPMAQSKRPPFPSVDFDLRQLEIFRKVVELSSFSKAAKAVYLAQASVSERIATLETMVGTRLLDRMGRRVIPTKAGEILYKHAVLLLEMKETACLEMQEFLGTRKGRVSLGGSTIPGEYILPRLIGGFREKYPSVSVTLSISDSEQIRTSVLEGALELGVVGSPARHRSLISNELWKDELVLAIPAEHPWASRAEVDLAELPAQPFIFREEGSGTFKILEEFLKKDGSFGLESLTRVAELGTSTAVKEGIKAGLGISILSARALDTELKTGMLKALRIRGLRLVRSFHLVRDRRRIASPLCRALLDFLLASAEKER